MKRKNNLKSKLKKIKMILLDVDGVLTDGKIILSSDGVEYKNFHAHDGYGILKAKRAGIIVGLVSGRTSEVVSKRADRLGLDLVYQGNEDKLSVFQEIKKKYNISEEETAFVGDDEFDIPLLKSVGFSAAPANAINTVKKVVDYVTKVEGGNGAAREVIDLILKAKKN
ncbi:MAG: 3-deoxy-D-manno-octulosonate 8-phosphate phosphatase [Ignavibacteriae bacterium]|nr:MAG: 3-deoxy-D-manno-octulosonate 8-phosphate phosphatase [Ignavibacteriota bacterium]